MKKSGSWNSYRLFFSSCSHKNQIFGSTLNGSESVCGKMGNSNIKQHIETASKTGACQLSRMGLKELPPDLIRLTKNLRTLDVSHNKIQHLCPPNLGLFTMLRQLVVSDNQLHHLPDEEMKQLKKLECLSAEMNFLTSLPPVIASLANLRTVNLSKNLFQVFPEQLCCLKNLDAVDLSCNRITRFPANINELHAIELNLNQNQVRKKWKMSFLVNLIMFIFRIFKRRFVLNYIFLNCSE